MMDDFKKSKKELIAELVELRKQVSAENTGGAGIKKNGDDEKFHVLFETAQDAIFIMKDGLYVDCNQRALEIFKCAKEQIIDSSPETFSPALQPDGEKSRTLIKRIIKAAVNGMPQFFKWQHKKYDQTLFSAEVSIKKFEFSNEIYILAIVRDITEIKKTQDELAESQQRYELATTAAKVGVWDFNPETKNLYVDTHMKRMLGYDDEDVSEHMDGWFSLVHPDDKEMVYDAVGAHLKGETEAVEITHRMIHKDGSIRW
ncbi:MAG: PAS domain-containing protein, partial [Calditrichaceae bacterium]